MTTPTQAQIEAGQKFDGSDIRWRDEMIRELKAEVERLTAAAQVGENDDEIMELSERYNNAGIEINQLRRELAALAAAQVGEPPVRQFTDHPVQELISHTIERCAQVAEGWHSLGFRDGGPVAIAAAIRKLKDAP